MHRFFILNHQNNPTKEIIPQKDLLNQLKKVLRIRKEEQIICIYENYELTGILVEDKIIIKDVKTFSKELEKPSINLIQGISTNKKMAMIVQKAVELNANNIIFWQAHRSTTSINDFISKKDRFEKIVLEACEQTRRNIPPVLNYLTKLENQEFGSNDLVITLYENETKIHFSQVLNDLTAYDNIYLIIGPEGGIEPFELDLLIKKGSKIVTSGKNILRTETAAYYALAVLDYLKNS